MTLNVDDDDDDVDDACIMMVFSNVFEIFSYYSSSEMDIILMQAKWYVVKNLYLIFNKVFFR